MAHIVPDLILRSWVIASFGPDPRDRTGYRGSMVSAEFYDSL